MTRVLLLLAAAAPCLAQEPVTRMGLDEVVTATLRNSPILAQASGTVRVGSFAHWRVVNRTREVHPFHIHRVHFLTPDSLWLDTLTVPPGDSLDIVLDARHP